MVIDIAWSLITSTLETVAGCGILSIILF